MRRGVIVLSAVVVPLLLGHAGSVEAQSAQPTVSTPGALTAADVAIACSPSLAVAPVTVPALRVAGGQDTVPRRLMGTRDLAVVNGGTRDGVQLNQRYFIRRPFAFGYASKGRLQSIHTSGWLRIVSVNEVNAIAAIEHSCDGVIAGDYLEPFTAPAAFSPAATTAPGTPDFSMAARVLFGDEERRIGATGDFMLLDGTAPLGPGARVAIYRDLMTPGVPLAAVGEGVVEAMANGSPVVRITVAKDAIRGGDYAVPIK